MDPPSLTIQGTYGIPQRGGQFINRDDWLPMRGEEKKDYLLRLLKEGHTAPDAMMTCACAQVGQVRRRRGLLLLSGECQAAVTVSCAGTI